jgi:hypothetical protein
MVCMHGGSKTRRGTTVGHIEKSEFRGEAEGGSLTHQRFFRIQLQLGLLEKIHIPSGNVYIKFQSSETNIELSVGRSNQGEGEKDTPFIMQLFLCI